MTASVKQSPRVRKVLDCFGRIRLRPSGYGGQVAPRNADEQSDWIVAFRVQVTDSIFKQPKQFQM